ncbi:MAG: Do family serine endopeptidase [Deltaproteobacteria bacterium]|nr:Do family serine endopeptidase [Deltaproteobacteria bacterium]
MLPKENTCFSPFRRLLVFVLPVLLATVFLPSGTVARERITPVVQAVQRVAPAVVNINSEYEVRSRRNPFSGFPMDPFFDSFFKDFFDPGFERRYKRTSLGSGVIIDGERGFILTNAHVIARTGTVSVTLMDEREFKAAIVGADPDSDLAVLRVDSAEALPSVEMGNSDDLFIGETVIAIGNPFGFSHTVTTGVISALHRSLRTDDRVFIDFIQTDASINPGNSGGPLLNIHGEVIGINTAIYAKAQGIGFAIPINRANRIVQDLIRYGEVVPSWIGIVVQDVDEGISRYLGLPHTKGVLVKAVEEKSPAETAGIQAGDVLLAVGLHKVRSTEDYQAAVKQIAAGETVSLRILRKNTEKRISLTTRPFPPEMAEALAVRRLGVRVENRDASRQNGSGNGASEGVVITWLDPRSELARIGARPGDIIRQIDEITVRNVEDFKKAVIQYRQKPSVVILLQRGNQGYYITVRL